MLRITPAVLAAFALAALAVSLAAPPATAEERTVSVKVDCRSGGKGPGSVTVDPWLLWLSPGDVTIWSLNDAQEDTEFVVEAKNARWPYTETKHEGLQGKAYARDMTSFPYGDYRYNIRFHCNGEEYVIDPRVRVGP